MVVLNVAYILGGFVLVSAGALILVKGSAGLADHLSLSKSAVGVTIVAFGTSLPELMAVITASATKQHDIGLGNIIGSNVINVLGILGLAVIFLPITTTERVTPTTLVAFVAASLYLLYCVLYRKHIGRIDGVILVTAFVLFTFLNYLPRTDQ